MLRDDLIRYCRVVKDMNDPIKVATVGIEKLNRCRAERHKYLCSRYNLSRQETLRITDNLPMEKSVEELADYINEKICEMNKNIPLTTVDPSENPWGYLTYIMHTLFYVTSESEDGVHIPTYIKEDIRQYSRGVRWCMYGYRYFKTAVIPFKQIEKGWRAIQYLCGKGDIPEDEFLTSVAFQTLEEVCYRLNEFRHDTSDDVPEEVKKKSYDSDDEE